MITLFENFKAELPFKYKEYMIFYYNRNRFNFKNILVYIEDEPFYDDLVIKTIAIKIDPESKINNINMVLKYNENVYTDSLDYNLNLVWRGFDKNEAINNINMLNNSEIFNL